MRKQKRQESLARVTHTHTHTQDYFNSKENKDEEFNEVKSSKGITLVALVVSIIVLLILSMVSVNALIGENGIISMAKESRTLSILADILFDTESEIVNINIDNIEKDQKYTALNMLNELRRRGKLTIRLLGFGHVESRTAYFFKDDRLNNEVGQDLRVEYNGDIWLGNYKRGKIQLSPETHTICSSNGKTNVTVIDGTVEEIAPNQIYYLHALDKDKFAYWLDKYGEIVSEFPDTFVCIAEPRDEEYVAIYDYMEKGNGLNLPDYGAGMVSRLMKLKDSNDLKMECCFTYLMVSLTIRRTSFK